ncbi:hypothetical protein ACFVMC_00175 [Nocardia sp. NPDC127579]|uniref:hypothetical protein n=1 Tax=Nocardia sp. NPDC127579 TaxID=3345402 RepID=UPI003643F362
MFRTEYGQTSADWFVDREGVIHVFRVNSPDRVIDVPHGPALGECLEIMPRRLWDRIRYEYEQDRDQWST